MDFFLEPFALAFQQRALLGGLIAALMSATVGVWLVLRGMSFFGDAFVHGILPGIAAAIMLDVSPYAGAVLAAAVMLVGVEIVHRQTALSEDTGIGLLFVGMLALGVVIISKSTTYTGSLTSILFGDALGVSRSDLIGQALLAAPVMLAALALYRPLLALSFDARKAKALGMRPTLAHALLLVLIAAAVIGSFQAVGTLLVFGLLVGPPATAALLARTVAGMFVWSIVVAVASVFIGLVASFHLGTAGSATMALVPILAFFVVLAAVAARARFQRRSSADPDGADAAVGGPGPIAESAHA